MQKANIDEHEGVQRVQPTTMTPTRLGQRSRPDGVMQQPIERVGKDGF
jgi:hypothetical protein